MTYNPQIPAWGEQYLEENKEKLVKYHKWLSITGVKTGLISPKTDQYIWDEFIGSNITSCLSSRICFVNLSA